MVPKASQSGCMPLPLVVLVRKAVHDSGRSIASFAEEKGLPYATVRRYTDVTLKPLRSTPRRGTLRQLALALDLPLSVVEKAAIASTFTSSTTTDGVGNLVTADGFDQLSEQERVEWVRQIYPMIEKYLP